MKEKKTTLNREKQRKECWIKCEEFGQRPENRSWIRLFKNNLIACLKRKWKNQSLTELPVNILELLQTYGYNTQTSTIQEVVSAQNTQIEKLSCR